MHSLFKRKCCIEALVHLNPLCSFGNDFFGWNIRKSYRKPVERWLHFLEPLRSPGMSAFKTDAFNSSLNIKDIVFCVLWVHFICCNNCEWVENGFNFCISNFTTSVQHQTKVPEKNIKNCTGLLLHCHHQQFLHIFIKQIKTSRPRFRANSALGCEQVLHSVGGGGMLGISERGGPRTLLQKFV